MEKKPVLDKFREALIAKFGKTIAGFTMEHLTVSLISGTGRFIVTDAKNIRVSGDGIKRRRVTATITALLGPDFVREQSGKYVLTFDGKKYKAKIYQEKKK